MSPAAGGRRRPRVRSASSVPVLCSGRAPLGPERAILRWSGRRCSSRPSPGAGRRSPRPGPWTPGGPDPRGLRLARATSTGGGGRPLPAGSSCSAEATNPSSGSRPVRGCGQGNPPAQRRRWQPSRAVNPTAEGRILTTTSRPSSSSTPTTADCQPATNCSSRTPADSHRRLHGSSPARQDTRSIGCLRTGPVSAVAHPAGRPTPVGPADVPPPTG